MTPKTIRFFPQDQECPIGSAQSVLEVALKNGIPLSHSCGGMGSCTTCRVFVIRSPSALPPRNELEQEMADTRGFADEERLACQLPPLEGLEVRIPETLASAVD